ncbi:MAG TPA: molecular chaperone DnaJ [Acidimicrobiales bacterium]|nr:molecular chaperone DnaJ [Acidimicrobiales bacterium]
MADDLYATLGVSRTATAEEIKRAYRRLARQHHPDANPGDDGAEARFKEIARAYEVLSDPDRRQRYDTYGTDGPGGPDLGDAFGAGGLGDLFDAFFGGAGGSGGGRRGGPRRGGDMEVVVDLAFEEAVFGAKAPVEAEVPAPCDTCEATGSAPGTHPTTCSTCGGAGQVRQVRQSMLGQMVTARPCPACGGQGQVVTSPCPDCGGEGRRAVRRTFTVDVPPGVDDGSTLRLPGYGPAGPRGGPAGDLYVHLRVAPHPRFTREDSQLVHQLHLSPSQAALGVSLDFETLDGQEQLVVPAGTQPGRVFRLRGRGVPRVRGRGRGDLEVRVVVDVPTGLAEEEEALYRRLAELRGEDVAPPEVGLLSKIRSAFK